MKKTEKSTAKSCSMSENEMENKMNCDKEANVKRIICMFLFRNCFIYTKRERKKGKRWYLWNRQYTNTT